MTRVAILMAAGALAMGVLLSGCTTMKTPTTEETPHTPVAASPTPDSPAPDSPAPAPNSPAPDRTEQAGQESEAASTQVAGAPEPVHGSLQRRTPPPVDGFLEPDSPDSPIPPRPGGDTESDTAVAESRREGREPSPAAQHAAREALSVSRPRTEKSTHSTLVRTAADQNNSLSLPAPPLPDPAARNPRAVPGGAVVGGPTEPPASSEQPDLPASSPGPAVEAELPPTTGMASDDGNDAAPQDDAATRPAAAPPETEGNGANVTNDGGEARESMEPLPRTSENMAPPDRELPGPAPTSSAKSGQGSDDGEAEPPPEADAQPKPGNEARQSQALARTVSSSTNTTSTVELPGVGWTYLGNVDAVRFERREVQAGNTRFTFRPIEPGDHRLAFLRQDLSQGLLEQAEITMETVETVNTAETVPPRQPDSTARNGVVSSAEANDTTEQTEPNLDTGETRPAQTLTEEQSGTQAARFTGYRERNGAGAYEEAVQLRESGSRSAALNEYLRQYDGNVQTAYNIAALADEMGESEIASFFWNEVASGTGAAAIEAHRILFDRSMGEADGELAYEHFTALDRADQLPSQEDRLELAGALLESEQPRRAEEVLTAGSSSPSAPAELLYLLARSYEDQKQPARAIEHYRELMDNYLLSSFYERARERYEYLRRHFVHVR